MVFVIPHFNYRPAIAGIYRVALPVTNIKAIMRSTWSWFIGPTFYYAITSRPSYQSKRVNPSHRVVSDIRKQIYPVLQANGIRSDISPCLRVVVLEVIVRRRVC